MTANVKTSEPKETKAKSESRGAEAGSRTRAERGREGGGVGWARENWGRPEKRRGEVCAAAAAAVAAGGALRTLDWDTSAINLSV